MRGGRGDHGLGACTVEIWRQPIQERLQIQSCAKCGGIGYHCYFLTSTYHYLRVTVASHADGC